MEHTPPHWSNEKIGGGLYAIIIPHTFIFFGLVFYYYVIKVWVLICLKFVYERVKLLSYDLKLVKGANSHFIIFGMLWYFSYKLLVGKCVYF